MAYQSLYRRYRPQRFGEVVGQERVTRTLQNAVRDDRVAHAYLFSGPRGTGKTSTARILAKALNCTNLQDGEPCGQCESCTQIAAGSSLDVMELDAASNNGVDAMRDLISRAALGTSGRAKVYIVDEVHMLSSGASNALLKTLEEPPGHVYFVLATTDPQKVLPTIKSRTQHFDFRLLPPDALLAHLKWVVDDAKLEVAPEVIELVARRGSGSARDALSALDQAAAAGESVHDEASPVDELVEALCDRDAGRVLVGMAQACGVGHDPRQLARDLVEHLRHAFLSLMARNLVGLPDDAVAHVEDQARRLGAPAVVRAIEVIGEALVEMREAVDPRIALEVALVRVASPDTDTSPAAMLERIERLERKLAGHVTAPTVDAAKEAVAPPPKAGKAEPAPKRQGPAAAGRAALGAYQAPAAKPEGTPASKPAPAPAPKADTPTTPTDGMPSRDELQLTWGDELVGTLSGKAKTRFGGGRWVSVEGDTAVFALPNSVHRDRCEEVRDEVEEALRARFGTTIRLRLEVDTGAAADPPGSPPPPSGPDEEVDLTDLRDAPAAVPSGIDHLKQAFPGAELVEE